MTSPVRRDGSRSLSDWTLLGGATLTQLAAAGALRVMSLPALRAQARRLRPIAQMLLRGSDDRIIWAVEATGRRLAPFSTCLVRALVIETRLSSRERPASLVIGVKRGPSGSLQSHAWVLRDGCPIVGGPLDEGFVRVATWESAT
jgi:hypothetical protein